jgi:hypothetical protein
VLVCSILYLAKKCDGSPQFLTCCVQLPIEQWKIAQGLLGIGRDDEDTPIAGDGARNKAA